VLEVVSGPGKLVIAFRHAARHTGRWPTPVGELAPTGRRIEAHVIDVLTVGSDGRISAVVVVADELSRLLQAGAIPAGPDSAPLPPTPGGAPGQPRVAPKSSPRT
jgi:hypothetical protein